MAHRKNFPILYEMQAALIDIMDRYPEYSAHQIADLSGFKPSSRNCVISNCRAGRTRFPLDRALDLCRALGEPVDRFLEAHLIDEGIDLQALGYQISPISPVRI